MAIPSPQRILRQLTHPLYRSLETIVHPLRYLFLEITQKCNLRCLHCGSDCGTDTTLNELSTDEWLDFLGYLRSNYDPKNFILVITGGEPMCHPDFFKIISKIKELGLQFGMVTNGWQLNQATLTQLMENSIRSITVSLDGLQHSHDWLRGRKGSYERALNGITLLAQSNTQLFDVVTCMNPRNLPELNKLLTVLQKVGVRRWRIFTIFPKGRAKENPELILSKNQMVQLLDWIKQTRQQLQNTGFQLDYSCEGYLPKQMDQAVRDEPYFCRAGICIGSVLGDGSISACPNISRNFIQGNIRTDDFREIWDTRFKKFRQRNWMKTEDCTNCDQWKRCQGNSLHLWDDGKKRTIYCHRNILAQKDGVNTAVQMNHTLK